MSHPADQLIAAWLTDDLDAEGVRALEEFLRTDATARARFARFCESEAVLPQALMLAPMRPGTTGIRRAVGAGSRVRLRRPDGRLNWLLPVAAAALVAVIVVVGVTRSAPPPSPVVAQAGPLQLVATGTGSHAVVYDGTSLRAGMFVPRGAQVEVRSAGTEFRWRDGTRLEASEGTRFRVLDGETALYLTAGGLDAHVTARGDTPFRIDTPHARTMVMGTRFAVAVRGEMSLLSVREGRVRFAASHDGATRELLTGETAWADGNGLVQHDTRVLGFVATGREVTSVLGKRMVGRATLRLADLPVDGINLRVDCVSEVKAVRAGVRGVGTPRLEQVRDYFVFGDVKNRATDAWKPRVGTFTIDAQAFADADGREPLDPPVVFELTIVP